VEAAGHLAKSPSFWIKRVDFVRQYQKIDGFWLPIREQSIAKVKIYGTKILTIGYQDYTVSEVSAVQALLTNAADVHMERNRSHVIVLAPLNSHEPNFAGSSSHCSEIVLECWQMFPPQLF
jgi:hypothetical protein